MSYGLLYIPDYDFDLASSAISNDLAEVGSSVDTDTIGKILRSYVFLAAEKKAIGDFSVTLSTTEQSNIIKLVAVDATGIFSTVDEPTVQMVLIDLERLGRGGVVNQYIPFPRKWETEQERGKAAANADTAKKHPGGVFGDAFTSIGKSLSNFLSGLGLNPLELILIAGAIIVAIFYFKGRK